MGSDHTQHERVQEQEGESMMQLVREHFGKTAADLIRKMKTRAHEPDDFGRTGD